MPFRHQDSRAPGRYNLFTIHGWDNAERYSRMVDLVRSRESGLADYSVPPWKALPGDEDQVAEGIKDRMQTASAIVVLNSPGLHRRPWSLYEMQLAVGMGKRIVVLQPHGHFEHPIPEVLDGHVYRVSPWRGDVLGRAIRGEYPYDHRVFDIAEIEERRDLVAAVAVTSGCVSFLVSAVTACALRQLSRDLEAQGLRLQWTGDEVVKVARPAIGGALVAAGLAALLTGDAEATAMAAIAGAGVGVTVGLVRTYRARLHGVRRLQVLTIAPT